MKEGSDKVEKEEKIAQILSEDHTDQVFGRYQTENLRGVEMFCIPGFIFYPHRATENMEFDVIAKIGLFHEKIHIKQFTRDWPWNLGLLYDVYSFMEMADLLAENEKNKVFETDKHFQTAIPEDHIMNLFVMIKKNSTGSCISKRELIEGDAMFRTEMVIKNIFPEYKIDFEKILESMEKTRDPSVITYINGRKYVDEFIGSLKLLNKNINIDNGITIPLRLALSSSIYCKHLAPLWERNVTGNERFDSFIKLIYFAMNGLVYMMNEHSYLKKVFNEDNIEESRKVLNGFLGRVIVLAGETKKRVKNKFSESAYFLATLIFTNTLFSQNEKIPDGCQSMLGLLHNPPVFFKSGEVMWNGIFFKTSKEAWEASLELLNIWFLREILNWLRSDRNLACPLWTLNKYVFNEDSGFLSVLCESVIKQDFCTFEDNEIKSDEFNKRRCPFWCLFSEAFYGFDKIRKVGGV